MKISLGGITMLLTVCLLSTACTSVVLYRFTPPAQPVNMLYDDDCDGDIDCAVTQPVIHRWISNGWINMLGMVSSSATPLGAPTMKVFQHYYGHNGFQIGALTPQCGGGAPTHWTKAVVDQLDAGDTCTNYEDCAIVLRKSITQYAASGGSPNNIVYVLTGPLTCEERFRASPGDAISPLTGAQLEQKYIQKFILLNGAEPNGAEYNCTFDFTSCSSFFTNVTSRNGYPPVYAIPVNTGVLDVTTSVPLATLSPGNPSAIALTADGSTQAQDEDVLTVEYAVYGETGWAHGPDSTNVVNPSSGTNSWNTNIASGQYYVSPLASQSEFEALFSNVWTTP